MLGSPVRAEWPVPEGWTLQRLEASECWAVLETYPAGALIVPLALDTLPLPQLAAWSAGDTVMIQPPVIVVDRTMPDTLYVVAPFPAPLEIPGIPPGFPSDYLEPHRFWLTWREPPPGPPWLLIGGGALLLASALAAAAISRRRGAVSPGTAAPPGGAPTLADAILALLDGPQMASGDFPALYRELDGFLRKVVQRRFFLDPSALTYRQMRAAAGSTAAVDAFFEEAGGVIREITLQRYAGWGTTRERAGLDVRKVASLAGGGGGRAA